ncbi:MAG: MFS transporter [Arthrobacter sp.]|nr:MFS transporter [Arthrobacter sp.]
MSPTPAPASNARSGWAGLILLAVAIFAVITTEVVPIGILPRVVQDFGLDESAGGMLVSLYAGLVAVTAVPLTRFTGSLPRKPVLLSTLVIFTASNLLAALAPSFAWLVVARAVGGMAHALFFALAIGYATRIAPPGSLGKAMAMTSMGASAGFILGVPAGTALSEAAGWRVTFGALAALTAVAFVVALVLLPGVKHDAAASRTLVPGGGSLLLVASLAGLTFLGHYCLYTFVSPLILSTGLNPVWLSPVLVLFGVAGLFAIRAVAPRLDAHPVRWMILVPVSILISLAATVLAMPALWPTLVIAGLWGACFAPVNSTFQNVLVRVGKENPEMAGAWINVTCNLGIGGGAALGGLALDASGLQGAGWLGCGILALTVLATLALRPRLQAAAAR